MLKENVNLLVKRVIMVGFCILFLLWRHLVVTERLTDGRWFGFVTDLPATVVAAPDTREFYTFLNVRIRAPNGQETQLRVKTSRYTNLKPGDQFVLTGEIKEPPTESFDNESDFNYQQYLLRYYITGLVEYPQITELPAKNYRFWPIRGLYWLRLHLETAINRLLPEPEASFLAGLLVGTRRSIPPSTLDDLTKTGTTHIIAVSGANVVIVANLVLFGLRYLTLNNHLSVVGSQITIWAFVLLTGGSAAAARGGLVSSLSQLLKFSCRPITFTNTLLFPAWLTMAINPLIYTDIGWQLSFAAFAGIILLPKWWEEKLSWLKLPPIIKQPLIETSAASTGVLPVSIYHFGAFSLTTWVANPAILWLIPLAMGVGFSTTLLSLIFPWLITPLRCLGVLPLKTILLVIHLFTLVPNSYYKV